MNHVPRANDLKYVCRIVGRDGVGRYYFRKRGKKDVRLPDTFRSDEFMRAYEAARASLAGIEIRGTGKIKAGTVAAVAKLYMDSAPFTSIAAESQRSQRNILRCLCDGYPGEKHKAGDLPIAQFTGRHLQTMLDRRAHTPSAARNLRQVLRGLFGYAVKHGLIEADPTRDLTHAKIEGGGFETWGENEIAKFQAHWMLGTKQRLAFELALCTGQRRGDIVTMGRHQVHNGLMTVKQRKTGAEVTLPMPRELHDAIKAAPSGHMVFLVNKLGQPYADAGFTNFFHAACTEAGIKNGLSAHGLRKAMCRRLAEAGATTQQIMAVSGHKTLREVEVYTRDAEKKRLAGEAMALVYPARNVT
jgi:integrase